MYNPALLPWSGGCAPTPNAESTGFPLCSAESLQVQRRGHLKGISFQRGTLGIKGHRGL